MLKINQNMKKKVVQWAGTQVNHSMREQVQTTRDRLNKREQWSKPEDSAHRKQHKRKKVEETSSPVAVENPGCNFSRPPPILPRH
jgi:hypothetical protein